MDITSIPQVNAQEVYDSIDSNECVILDVRTDEENLRSRIKNSINIPLDKIEDEAEKRISDKSKTIYVYCLSGSRSQQAVVKLMQMNYENAKSMTSGLLAWRSLGYPLEGNQ